MKPTSARTEAGAALLEARSWGLGRVRVQIEGKTESSEHHGGPEQDHAGHRTAIKGSNDVIAYSFDFARFLGAPNQSGCNKTSRPKTTVVQNTGIPEDQTIPAAAGKKFL